MARVGNRRAPHRAGGGKAHGPVPRDRSFVMNKKQRLLGLKTMMTACLFENKFVFVDSEELEVPKTKYLH